ncbi:MAG: response regulator [Candidatus Aminicenantes bacterium]|nr:response regulator [Candidatus Aminicenantes bacterium]
MLYEVSGIQKKGTKMKKNNEKKVVVVDDDESIRKTFFLLLHENYKVYPAKDSDEALKRFQGEDIDLIIADMRLPQHSGLQMLEKFRDSGYKGKAILISAFPDLVNPKELNQAAVDCFFVKPLELEALTQSIEYLLGHSRGSGEYSVKKQR